MDPSVIYFFCFSFITNYSGLDNEETISVCADIIITDIIGVQNQIVIIVVNK